MKTMKFLICILALLIAPLAQATGVGMVLDVRGAATAEKGGKKTALEITDPILPGMKVSVTAGGEIGFVFYPRREMVVVTGPATLTVGETAVKPEQGNLPRIKPLPQEKTQVAQGFQGNLIPAALVMKRMSGGKAPPQLTSPANGETVLTDRVTFAWEASATSVKFRLFDESKLLHEQVVQGKRLELPANVPLREGRAYRWDVAEEGAPRALAEFSLASTAVRKQLAALRPSDSAPVADWTLYGLGLQQAGAISEARAVWRRIGKDRPESAAARELAE